jgi:hypothetical protein
VELPLQGVKKTILDKAALRDVLDVRIEPVSSFKAVVCVSPHGTLGSLTAFPGLKTLIDCIEAGNRYTATIIKKEKGSCTVRVRRV